MEQYKTNNPRAVYNPND